MPFGLSGMAVDFWNLCSSREMMVRQVARQFCRLREVHSLVYGRRAGSKNGRKLTAALG